MNDLETFLACMEYKPADRRPFWVWGGWPETMERWHREGWDGRWDTDLACDRRNIIGDWFNPYPPFERKVVEETDRHVVYVNHEGILMREFKNQPANSMPQFIKFPVETRQEFRAFWRERMPYSLDKRRPDWKDQLLRLRREDGPLIIIADRWGGFFGPLRNLLGVERLCMTFYDDPAWLEEMMDAEADYVIEMMRQVCDVTVPEGFGFWEDMAYNHAPLVSPEMARRYMLPRYKRVTDYLRSRGVKYIGLDSDGQCDSLIPVWLDAGLNFLYPFEVQAGMDVVAIRKKYGRSLRIFGGVDKRAVAAGKAAIDAELARLRPLVAEGGYIPHTDHGLPPDVSFQNFVYYMRQIREMVQSDK